jgi:hypothetical protein
MPHHKSNENTGKSVKISILRILKISHRLARSDENLFKKNS